MKYFYLLTVPLLLVIVMGGSMFAQNRPSVAYPISDEKLINPIESQSMIQSKPEFLSRDILSVVSSCTDGGNRLVSVQNTDGGWGWPLTGTSAQNTIGPIGMGLAQAYQQTGVAGQRTALTKVGSFLLAKTNNFSPSDGYLAAQLDKIFGGNTYRNHVKTNFYDKLADSTYDRLGLGVLYSTATYVAKIRTDRANQGIPNLAAWDVGMGLVGAAMCGGNTAEWIAGVKAEIDELDGDGYYDVVGLAGAIYGLAFVDEDFDPTAGEHAAASNINDLAAILASYQINGGGFTWNSNYMNPGEDNETIQETGYAILALNEVNRNTYLSAIQGAADYMMSVQLGTGGWEDYNGSGENNEVTAEALWGICTAYMRVHNVTKDIYYATIQDAVNDASPGDSIYAAEGTYEEQIEITINLSLAGAGMGSTSIISPPTLTKYFATTYNNYPIVYIHNTGNVLIKDITVDGAGRGNSNYRFIGIGFRNAGGTVNGCEVKNIMDTPFSGAQHGVAIYAYNDDGTSRNIYVLGNTITAFQKNAMALNAGDTTPLNVSVVGNTITGAGPTGVTAQNGVQVWADLGTGNVEDNNISGIGYTGSSWVATSILNFYADLNITGNTVNNAHVGIYNIDGAGDISENDLTISKIGNHGFGIIATDPPSAKPSPFDEIISSKSNQLQKISGTNATLAVNILKNLVSFSGGDNTTTIGIEADAGYGSNNISLTVSNNDISGFETGIGIYECTSGCDIGVFTGVTILNNSIEGATYAIYSDLTTPRVDASGNWFGINTPAGVAALITGDVDYTPWLNVGTDINPGTMGFQGDFSSLWVDDNSPQSGTLGRIQEGINLVTASTVNVAPGTYNEYVIIDKSITLTGDRGDPNVAGPGTNAPVMDGTGFTGRAAFKIQAGVNNVTIEGFEIKNYGPNGNTGADGIVAWNPSNNNVIVRDNYMHDLGYAGVLTGNGWGDPQGVHDNWQVTYNIVQTTGAYAFDMENVKNSVINRNIISGLNYYAINVIALATQPGFNITVENVEVKYNTIFNCTDRIIDLFAWTDGGTDRTAIVKNVNVSNNTITGMFNLIVVWGTGPGTEILRDLVIDNNDLIVNNPKSAGSLVDLADAGGSNSFSGNTINITGAVGGGGTFFHGVDIKGSATGTWVMNNNQLDGNYVGANSCGYRLRNTLPSSCVLNINGGTITEFANGIRSDDITAGADINIHNAIIKNNSSYGILNGTGIGAMIDAVQNHWGTLHGPQDNTGTLEVPRHPKPSVTDMKNAVPATNLGNAVSENVDYFPWIGPGNSAARNGGIWLSGYINPVANSIFAGFDPAAEDGVDPRDTVAPPPPPSDYLYLYFLLAPGQPLENYSVDIKKEESSLASVAKHWDLRVLTDHTSSEVTLEFPLAGLPDGFKPTLYDLTTGDVTNLRESPFYVYTSPSTVTPSPFLLLIGDSTKPTVHVNAPNGGEFLIVGQPYTVTWSSSDATGVLKHEIYWSATGATPYTFIDEVPGNVYSYNWTPTTASNTASIKVIAIDSVMNEETDVSDYTFWILPSNTTTYNAAAGWNLISVPLQQTDMSPAGVFGDDYTAPYYTFQYNSSSGYSVPSILNMGQGYWLGSNSAQIVDAVGTPLTDVDKLLTNGFNIIGNPYAIPILKSDLRFTKGAETKTMSEAASAGWLSNVLYGYSGTGYYIENTALGVWGGYWIPMLQSDVTIEYKTGPGVPSPVTMPLFTSDLSDGWSVNLSAELKMNDGTVSDKIAAFGVHSTATDGFDPLFDAPRPPRSPNDKFIEISFTADGKDYPNLTSSYARDYRKSSESGWEILVTASHEGVVTLRWDNSMISQISADMKVELYDVAGGRVIDMKKVDSYSFDQTGTTRRFLVNRNETKVPVSFELVQNYPNPFNPSTKMQFSLPVDADVKLEVYDCVGRLVSVLANGFMKAGYHEISFDASQLASGVYIYRLSAVGKNGTPFFDSKKMILAR